MESLEEKKEDAKRFLEKLKIKMREKEFDEKKTKRTENDVGCIFYLYC